MLRPLKYMFYWVLGFILMLIIVWVLFVLMLEIKGKTPPQQSCPPLPVVDGVVRVKTDEGVELLLPHPADMRRYDIHAGCDYASSIYLNYFWYKGELIPAYQPPRWIPTGDQNKLIKVVMSVVGSGNLEDRRRLLYEQQFTEDRPWRFDDPIAHNIYPLEYYPKLNWDSIDGPTKKSQNKDLISQVWGVTHTKYKQIVNNKNFTAFCGIPVAKKEGLPPPEDRDFNPRDFECRGNVSAAKAGKYLVANLIVSTFAKEHGKEEMKKLNLIYDAAIKKLQSTIKEK